MRVAFAVAGALVVTSKVFAHESEIAAAAGSSWDVATLVLLAAAGAMYALGAKRMARRGARHRTAESAAFWTGLLALVTAVAPPLDLSAARLFSSHMLQHELLMRVGAPLLIAGRPVVPWLWSLPEGARRRVAASLQPGIFSKVWQWLTAPVVACALHGATIWIWHAPALYEAAVQREAVHAVQHATFVSTALLFWWGLVYGRYGRAAYGASVLYVFVTMLHTGALGAVFAFSREPFYAVYRDRALNAGVDAAADQQLAGVYMWVPSGLVLTLFGLALLVAWLAESERRTRWRAARLADDRSAPPLV